MSIICHVCHSSDDFTWDRKSHSFVAEASDFNGKQLFGQVYDDAIDEGFKIVSAKTGKAVTFAIEEYLTDIEGELTGWFLIPVDSKVNCKVFIFND